MRYKENQIVDKMSEQLIKLIHKKCDELNKDFWDACICVPEYFDFLDALEEEKNEEEDY